MTLGKNTLSRKTQSEILNKMQGKRLEAQSHLRKRGGRQCVRSGRGETGGGAADEGGRGPSPDPGCRRTSPALAAAAGTPEEATRPLLRGAGGPSDGAVAEGALASLGVRFRRFVRAKLQRQRAVASGLMFNTAAAPRPPLGPATSQMDVPALGPRQVSKCTPAKFPPSVDSHSRHRNIHMSHVNNVALRES